MEKIKCTDAVTRILRSDKPADSFPKDNRPTRIYSPAPKPAHDPVPTRILPKGPRIGSK